jgi:hypothetical protein
VSDQELKELAMLIYWDLEHGQVDDAVKRLRWLQQKTVEIERAA